MSDWSPGDLALCISNEHPRLGKTKLVSPGRMYTVTGVYVSRSTGYTGLVLAEATPAKNPGFHAFLFRKVTPPEADAFDRETIDLLNREPVEA